MPQVSKRILRKEVEEKVAETFLEAISQVRDKGEVQLFINDLLTPVERVMIAKRLAIATLLLKGWDYRSIEDFLKVSGDTIARVSLVLKTNNGYKKIVDRLAETEAVKEFWRDVVSLAYRLGSSKNVFVEEGLIKHKLGLKGKTLL